MRFIAVGTTILVAFSIQAGEAAAQSLLPAKGEPDVIWVCYRNDKPAAACRFVCQNEFQAPRRAAGIEFGPPAKKQDIGPQPPLVGTWNIEGAERVELYAGGQTGRVDTRSWLAYQFRSSAGAAPRRAFLYFGPTVSCGATIDQEPGVELRVERFIQ